MTGRKTKKKKKVSEALRQVRKSVPPPTRVQASKKAYRGAGRTRTTEETGDDTGC